MQLDDALLAAGAADTAMDFEAGLAEGPGDRATRVEAGCILPAHPVEGAAMRVQSQQAQAGKVGDRRSGGQEPVRMSHRGSGSGKDRT